MAIALASINRFPVKGLSAEVLESVELTADRLIPHDRRFAIAHGAGPVSQATPEWQSKAHFLQVMSVPRLAALETVYDADTAILEIRRNGRQVARGALDSRTGRTVIEQFFAAYARNELRGAPKILDLEGGGFTDTDRPFVSIVNLASVRDLERVVGAPVAPERFRGNLTIDGEDAWAEANWIGRNLAIGDAVLRVEAPIGRCAATNANPGTGIRDLTIPHDLRRGFGHGDCGVYARVVTGGRIARGVPVSVVGEPG